MADKTMPIFVPSEKPVKVAKWKVKRGAFVSQGQILFLYNDSSGKSVDLKKFKATRAGTISSIKVKEGDIAEPGAPLAELEECRHSTVMKEMCAECGADLRVDEAVNKDVAVVPMVHSVPELKVSEELAQKLGREDAGRLLKDRKLVLLVDLDQTLVHTTNENVAPNLKDVLHFFLRGPGSPGRWCHTRLRPRTKEFLESASKNYELHVCTFGARQYAHAIADLLDPEKKFFSHRILSRDECFDPRTKSANLKALFPCGDHMVCIIDDREDVWRHAANLIHVRPYSFFQNTGDINAPPPPVDEKPKLPCGKNGSQSISNQMPMLDVEPDAKKEKENDKSTDGSNGIINNDSKTSDVKKGMKTDITAVDDMKSDVKADNDMKKDLIGTIGDKMDIDEDDDGKTKANNDHESKRDSKVIGYETDDVSDVKTDTKPVGDENADVNIGDVKLGMKATSDLKTGTKVDDEVKTDAKLTSDLKKPAEDEIINDSEPHWIETADKQIEVEDPDDYLIYLEDILKRIHQHFYDLYDKMGKKQIPDLKCVIPEVKGEVLAGTSLVFSGLVPTHQKLHTSRAYMVAKSLGAEITQDYTDKTTHLVAVRAGTAKVNASRRLAEGKATKLQVVTPDWLWTCAERWERVDERLYSLQRGGQSSSRRPPAHCSSPPAAPPPAPVAAARRRTPSGRFMDTLNPLLSFSRNDIADMDREVEDIFNESDESSTDEESKHVGDDLDDEENPPENRLISVEAEDSSQDRLPDTQEAVGSSDSEDEESRPRKRPRRSSPPSDEEPPDDDDSSWNLMGAALERELETQD